MMSHRADRVTGGAALVLFVSLFVPWFPVSVNLLLTLVAFAFEPGGGSSLVKVSWSFGAFAGLISAIVCFAPMAASVIRARSGRTA